MIFFYKIVVCRWDVLSPDEPLPAYIYDDKQGMFLHEARTIETNESVHPLPLVFMFVAIVTRLGLCAAPVPFPGHVHAWVCLPGAESDDDTRDWEGDTPIRRLAVDVFPPEKEPFRHSDAMRDELDDMDASQSQRPLYMRPAMASFVRAVETQRPRVFLKAFQILERAATNALNSTGWIERFNYQGEERVSGKVRRGVIRRFSGAFNSSIQELQCIPAC